MSYKLLGLGPTQPGPDLGNPTQPEPEKLPQSQKISQKLAKMSGLNWPAAGNHWPDLTWAKNKMARPRPISYISRSF